MATPNPSNTGARIRHGHNIPLTECSVSFLVRQGEAGRSGALLATRDFPSGMVILGLDLSAAPAKISALTRAFRILDLGAFGNNDRRHVLGCGMYSSFAY